MSLTRLRWLGAQSQGTCRCRPPTSRESRSGSAEKTRTAEARNTVHYRPVCPRVGRTPGLVAATAPTSEAPPVPTCPTRKGKHRRWSAIPRIRWRHRCHRHVRSRTRAGRRTLWQPVRRPAARYQPPAAGPRSCRSWFRARRTEHRRRSRRLTRHRRSQLAAINTIKPELGLCRQSVHAPGFVWQWCTRRRRGQGRRRRSAHRSGTPDDTFDPTGRQHTLGCATFRSHAASRTCANS